MIIISLVAAALAAGLWVVPVEGRATGRWADSSRRSFPIVTPWTVGTLGGGLAALLVGGLAFGGRGLAVTASLLAVGATMARVLRTTVRTRRAAAARADVAHACQVLARLVAAGQTPHDALQTAAEDCPVLVESATMLRVGGDPVSVWRRASSDPGHGGLLALARAWSVSHVTGAAMSRPLADVAVALRGDRAVTNVVQAELSAPRATGRLLAMLPLVGLGLGYLIGSDPVHFLLDSWIGQLCLVVGVLLACTGVIWVERLAAGPVDPAGPVGPVGPVGPP